MRPTLAAEAEIEAVYDAACDRGGLTRRQLLIWAGDRIAGGAPVFVEAARFRLRGALDVERYARAFAAVAAESDALRTRIDDVDGWPQRVDDPAVAPRLDVVDLTRAAAPREAFDDLARDAAWSCARTRGPLVSAKLVRVGPEDHALLLAQHQLVSDSWSFGIVHDRLLEHYRAQAGTGEVVPTVPPQFADYVEHERRLRTSPRAGEARAYWRSAYVDSVLRSASGAVGPHATRVQRIVRRLGPARSRALHEVAAESASRDVGIFAVFASVVAAHVHRTTGRRELLLSLPFANRPSARFKQTLGTFMNVCPIRIAIAPDDTFAALRDRVTAAMWEAARHQGYAGRVAGAAEPYDVLVNVHRSALAGDAFDACAMQVDWVAPTHRYGGVLLAVHDFGATGDVALVVDLNEATFGAATRLAFVESVLGMLDAQLGDPDRKLADVDRARDSAAGTSAEVSPHGGASTVWGRLVMRARRTPCATALRVDGQAVTYAELVAGSSHVDRMLGRAGVGRGAIVAVWGARGRAWLQAMLAIWARGAVYLPIDPSWPAARVAEVLRQSGAGLVLTDREPPAVLAALASDAPWSILALGEDGDAAPACVDAEDGVAPRDLAYVIFTSGSTGAPKGALIEHGAFVNHLDAKIALLELGAGDRVAHTAAAGFDISLWQALAPLLVGAEVEILGDEIARDPVALRAAVSAGRITIVEVVPAVLRALLDVDEAMDPEARPLAHLRWLVVTGEALAPELCRRWLRRYPAVPLVNAYGPTECADDVTHHVVRTPPAADEVRTPIGHPIPGITVHVLDEGLAPVRDGEPGEICIGGIGVGRGYVNDPDRTAAAFVTPDPFVGRADTRLYRTGDRGRRRPDGALEWLGRLDAQVKIRGTRVEPAEVEAVLAAHPAVREAAVVARPSGDGVRLEAFVVLAAPDGQRLEAVRAFVAERLPTAMLPSSLISLPGLPRTTNGKLDYGALAAREAAPPADDATPPETPLEREVAVIWTRLLGAGRIGRHDEFFALGGDSLLAHQMLLEVRRALVVEVDVEAFLTRPTVAGLAATIAERQVDGLAALDVEALLDEVEALSDAEAARLVAAEAAPDGGLSVIDDG